MTLGQDQRHARAGKNDRNTRIGVRSASCAFLRTGYFCAAQPKALDIAKWVQCGIYLLKQVAFVLRHSPPNRHEHRYRASATGTGMSLRTVQVIVGRLVTDEEYRLKFLRDPIRALTTLRDQGVELTSAEIDALIRTDRTLWSDTAARIDPHLQRSSWLAD